MSESESDNDQSNEVESESEDELELEAVEDFDEEIVEDSATNYDEVKIQNMFKYDTDLYDKCIGIMEKNKTLTENTQKELKRLLQYKYLIQHVYKLEMSKQPFNIINVFSNSEIKYKNEEKLKIEDREKIIELLFDFVDEKLSTIYGFTKSKSRREAYNMGLLLVKIIIFEHMSSKKVIGVISMNAYKNILNDIYNMCLNGVINPGEMIGSVIATSLSETLSQMTLNTFHLSGNSEKSKISSGMQRFSQILNNTKTDKIIDDLHMYIYFNEEDVDDLDKIATVISRFKTVKFRTLVSSMHILQDVNFTKGKTAITTDQKMLNSYIKTYNKFPSTASKLSLQVILSPEEMYNARMDIFEIEKELKLQFTDMLVLSTTINSLRLLFNTVQQNEYDSFVEMISKLKMIKIAGVSNIVGVDLTEEKIEYRDKDGNYLMRPQKKLFAKGVNLHAVLSNDLVDGYRSYCNDPNETMEYLGINAAKSIMVKEIINIYKSNGANPSPSIVKSLVAAMTANGFIASINSSGMNKMELSEMQQMTFEKADKILMESSLYGAKEEVNATSNNISLGQLFEGGTASFSIVA